MSDSTYPSELESVAVLRDGVPVQLRPIRPEDAGRLAAFHSRQSPESIYFRFFRHRPQLSDSELEYFTNIDYDRRMAFVALLGEDIVAVSRYEAYKDRNEAEVAFFVDDANQGRGLATIMLEYLAAQGRRREFDNFTATVLPENYRMLSVFRRAGFEVKTKFQDGVIEVYLGIEMTAVTSAVIRERARQAGAASVARILAPGSVAVVGVGRKESSVGRQMLRRIVRAGFGGAVYAVHPSAGSEEWEPIEGSRAVASLSEVEDPIDLVIVAAPASAAKRIIDDAVTAGAGSLLIVSAGFSDVGSEGAARERSVVRTAQTNGLRVVGPAAFGIANTADDTRLTALYAPVDVRAGSLGVASRSGPLGGAVVNALHESRIGISSFLGLGNQADVGPADALQYWGSDAATDVVAMYVDNVEDARSVAVEARVVSALKPILWVRPDSDDLAVVLAQAGVVLVDRVSEIAEVARLVIDQPVPDGKRVAVVSNASSVAKLAVAACRREGLEVVVPSSLATAGVDGALVVDDSESVSIQRGAALAAFERVVVTAAVSQDVDALVLALAPTLDSPYDELAVVLGRIDRAVAKPLVAVSLASDSRLSVEGMPIYAFPEEAASALGRYATYGEWRRTHAEAPYAPDDQTGDRIERAMAAFPDARTLTMLDAELPHLLEELEIDLVPYCLVGSRFEARQRAAALGYPVVLKAGGVDARRPGEAGGVALDLVEESGLSDAIGRMEEQFGTALYPMILQTMAVPGIALRIELEQRRDTGSVLSVSLGGNAGGLTERRVSRALPASLDNLRALLDEPWLCDLFAAEHMADSFVDLTASLVAVGETTPAVSRLCLDPVLVATSGLAVVEVEVEIDPQPVNILSDVRHL